VNCHLLGPTTRPTRTAPAATFCSLRTAPHPLPAHHRQQHSCRKTRAAFKGGSRQRAGTNNTAGRGLNTLHTANTPAERPAFLQATDLSRVCAALRRALPYPHCLGRHATTRGLPPATPHAPLVATDFLRHATLRAFEQFPIRLPHRTVDYMPQHLPLPLPLPHACTLPTHRPHYPTPGTGALSRALKTLRSSCSHAILQWTVQDGTGLYLSITLGLTGLFYCHARRAGLGTCARGARRRQNGSLAGVGRPTTYHPRRTPPTAAFALTTRAISHTPTTAPYLPHPQDITRQDKHRHATAS